MAAEAERHMLGGGPPAGEDKGDTFMTDLLMGKKQNSERKRSAAGSAIKPSTQRGADADSEMNADDIEEELRDVVFDYENSHALVLAADDFLTGNNSFDAQSGVTDNRSSGSKASMSSRVSQNKQNAKNFDPHKIKLLQDRLDDRQKARLEQLLKEVDENMEELMKEKAEYARDGMKSGPGGFGGAGRYDDTRSQMSRMTGAGGGRATTENSSNAYLYSQDDQSKIQEINDALQKFNPALVGSQMISNDNFDTEASVIASGKKPRGLSKNKLSGLNIQDDTRSQISMSSNISGLSRKSNVSLLDIGSIASIGTGGSRKLPGERGLRQAAERRTQKAQMAQIDAHLRRMQDTEDLSYSDATQRGAEGHDTSVMSNVTADGKAVIDELTLARLVDECRDEQEQRSLMENPSSANLSHIDSRSDHFSVALSNANHYTELG